MQPSDPSTTMTRSSPKHLKLAGIVGAVAAVAIVTTGLASRAHTASELADWTAAQALPTVTVISATRLGDAAALHLPGRIEAYSRAAIRARVGGYLKAWHHDIGASVKAGDVLAEIETPDLDQQLLQAKADLANAQANAALAESTARRWQTMLGTDAVSQQEVDEKTSAYAQRQAAVNAARANVDRLSALQGFKRLVAPFDGTVTARNTDVGALIDAAGSGPELFSVADTRKLRVYVQLAQNYVPTIHVGDSTELTVPEHPGRIFKATVESMANAVNASSGASLVQLAIDNSDGALLPGGYASVSIALKADAAVPAMTIPASSLIFDASGLHVATLGNDSKVAMRPVQISRDLGKVLEVTGLQPDDRLIDSPPDALSDGDMVQVAKADTNDRHDAPKHN